MFQRPQHLMTRAAREHRVVYVEEPQPADAPLLSRRRHASGVEIVTPRFPRDMPEPASAVRRMLSDLTAEAEADAFIAWYYTPMALDYADHLEPGLCVYDCMDELSAFKAPPPGLIAREDRLFEKADLVFTGGRSLYEAKRSRHPRVHAFPSSVDVAHFAAARAACADPPDQAPIKRPRIGFFGVIDERMDLDLVARAARDCPDVQFVFLGPVVKIDPASLPAAPNLHWLGAKSYDVLPAYLGGWNAGWMPFALNESTRFISPTKTPEFLAAGLPVVSTAVPDVEHDYGASGLVAIADASDVADRLRASLGPPDPAWRARVEARLKEISWDCTWSEMHGHLMRLQAERSKLQREGESGCTTGL